MELPTCSCLKNYPGTILVDTAPRSEAWSPTQQHAQVAATITMGALSHAPDADVKSRPSATAIKILQQALATTINAERAEPAEKTGFVLRILRFLR
jgi:hypothetical protein